MTNKKEPLSIIVVKTLLAVIIFAGVGTIIIGGGLLIGEQGKISEPAKPSQKQSTEIVEEEIKDETAKKLILKTSYPTKKFMKS